MDSLFKRYAGPFLLLDQYIRQGRLLEFIDEFIKTHNEDKLYELWLHKVPDKTFAEFKEEVEEEQQQEFKPGQLETTIKTSKSLLDNFNPNE